MKVLGIKFCNALWNGECEESELAKTWPSNLQDSSVCWEEACAPQLANEILQLHWISSPLNYTALSACSSTKPFSANSFAAWVAYKISFLFKAGAGWGLHVYIGAEIAPSCIRMAQLVPSIALTSLITYIFLRYSVLFQRIHLNKP